MKISETLINRLLIMSCVQVMNVAIILLIVPPIVATTYGVDIYKIHEAIILHGTVYIGLCVITMCVVMILSMLSWDE